ncbi:MAG: phage tail protein [Clostridia bacterium]|nr:phage tail protein [Clostridia bacterium]
MGFEKVYITKKGSLLAAKTLQGKQIEFDHAEIGSGALNGDARDKTALTTKVLECPINNIKITGDTQAQISFSFKNIDASNAFYFRELGLFAIDPDTKEKVLYAYSNAGTTAEYINNSVTELIEKNIDLTVLVDNASNVNITLDPNQVYVTEKELEAAIEEAREFVGKNYGIRRKITDNTSPAWERICDNIGLVANAQKGTDAVQNDFDSIYPWSDIKTYNYDTANKKVTAYIGEPGFAFDGSNGEVLTKIPEFWYKREVKDDYEYIYIADYARAGYKHSEEFSVGRYAIGLDAERAAHSYSGLIPTYNKTITAFRTLAKAVGDGFGQLDTRFFILQMLYLVEYAHYNSQSKLGNGVTSWSNPKALLAESNVNRIIVSSSTNFYVGRTVSIGTADAWNAGVASERTVTKIEDYSNGTVTGKAIYFDGAAVNIAVGNCLWGIGQKAGQCDELGMKSGCLVNDGGHSVIYRGIENIFGNMWQFIDGLNIKDYIAYICTDPTKYAVDTFADPYKEVGYTNLLTKDVYPNRMGYDENNPEVALPIEAGGSSGTGICDYYYNAEGNRIAVVGGSFDRGAKAGLFYWNLSNASSHSSWNCGARLLKYQ